MQRPIDVNTKTCTHVNTNGSVKTTYVWVCQSDNTMATLTSKACRQVTKYVETTAGNDVTTIQYWPIDNNTKWADRTYIQIWDNRTTLIYV